MILSCSFQINSINNDLNYKANENKYTLFNSFCEGFLCGSILSLIALYSLIIENSYKQN